MHEGRVRQFLYRPHRPLWAFRDPRESLLPGLPLGGFVFVAEISMTDVHGWLDLQKAAKYLSLSVRTLRTYIGHHEHPLPVRRVGGKWIGKTTDFDRFAEGIFNPGPLVCAFRLFHLLR